MKFRENKPPNDWIKSFPLNNNLNVFEKITENYRLDEIIAYFIKKREISFH